MMVGLAKEALEVTTAPEEELFAALVNNAIIQARLANEANIEAIVTTYRETYNENYQWLINIYARAQVQQELQEDIMRICQYSNESPKNSYTRIHHAIYLVAIVDAIIPFLIQTIFI